MIPPVRYAFVCQDFPEETFSVNRFEGEEGLSRLYRFDIELRSARHDIDLKILLSASCRLSLWVNGEERRIHGILSDGHLLRQRGEDVLYRVVLVPRLWQLGLSQASDVFLRQSVPDIVRQVLEDAGLTRLDYELALTRHYRPWPYRCQYGETPLAFLQRLMEREGIYYFFAQGENAEKIIITDHLQTHEGMKAPEVFYDPVSGLEGQYFGNSIQSLICHQKRVARQVVLRDYNDQTPSLDIKGQATIDPTGIGEINVFGLNIVSVDEGRELAEILAQQIRADAEVISGASTIGRLASGYTFHLRRYFLAASNRAYLVTTISHTGIDPTLCVSEGGRAVEAYRNQFTAIPADVQFRPAPVTQQPRIDGTLDAVIDAEGDGQYAEVDDEGRYKVMLPFDRQQREEGKASHWIRMSQTFAGEDEGMHFPLRKGTHVLLSFMGGDPDRPVITGAMPNAAHPSVITADNQTKSKIQTRAGNFIEMEDREESKRIKLYSPHVNTYMHLGAHNAPGDGIVMVSEGLHRQEIGGGTKATLVSKAVLERWAAANDAVLATTSDDELFNDTDMFQFNHLADDGTSQGPMTAEDEYAGDYHLSRRVGDHYSWKQGNDFTYGNGKTFQFGPKIQEKHARQDGIDRGETFVTPDSLGGLEDFDPSQCHSTKSWGDAIKYHSGNTYNWRDGADYGLGSGYSETHVAGTTNTLNSAAWSKDGCPPPPFSASGNAIKGEKSLFNTNTTAVDKLIGNQYSYVKGKTLNIITGNVENIHYGTSYNHWHTPDKEETEYITYQGHEIMISRTITKKDCKETWNYHPVSGVLSSYSGSSQCGHVNFETKLMPTFDTSIDISTLSFSFEVSVNSFGISMKGCKFSLGFQAVKVEVSSSGYLIEVPGNKMGTEVVEMNTKVNKLSWKLNQIKTKLAKVDATQADLKTGLIDFNTAVLEILS